MSVEIRRPNINSSNPNEQMQQMRSYLYQLTDQLNWALNTISGDVSQIAVIQSSNGNEDAPMSSEDAEKTFNALKGLIIKSAEIVEAYEQTMEMNFSSKYLAETTLKDLTYAEFIEYLTQNVKISPERITQSFTDIETIKTNIEGIQAWKPDEYETFQEFVEATSNDAVADIATEKANEVVDGAIGGINDSIEAIENDIVLIKEINAWIKTGKLEDDTNTFGVEVGEIKELNGETYYNKFARFTSEKISFYDSNGIEVAYLSDSKLYVKTAQLLEDEIIGKFYINGIDGFSIFWNN